MKIAEMGQKGGSRATSHKPHKNPNLGQFRGKKGHRSKKPSRSKLIKEADKVFGKSIVARDGKCLHPDPNHHGVLTCSHYFSRGFKYTRWEPDNCITICWWHHFKSKDYGWEFQKQRKEKHGWDGQYTLYMKNRLGLKRFQAMEQRAKQLFKEKDEFILQIIQKYQNASPLL